MAALDGLGFFTEGDLAAIGALLHYVNLTQMGERPAMRAPKREAPGALMLIDAATRASLELVRPKNDGAPTVFSAIDRTVTAAGARELMNRLVSPSADVELINRRLDAVAVFIDDWALRERIRTGAQVHARYEPRAVAAEVEARRPARSGRPSRRAPRGGEPERNA